jgi:all-trans-8'-apo-beta-carotenal 15,15'-oxygenase
VRFANGQARGALRVVESDGRREEREAGRPLYGSVASRARRIANALRGRRNNASNVSVLAWQGRIFGVVDLARPIEVSPETLETIGESDLEGAIARTFTAHLHRVARAPRLWLRHPLRCARSARPLRAAGAAARDSSARCRSSDRDPRLRRDRGTWCSSSARADLDRAGARRRGAQPGAGTPRGERGLIVPIDDRRGRALPVEPFFACGTSRTPSTRGEIVVDFVRHDDVSATEPSTRARATGA